MRKTKQYFKAACHRVWIVYPEQREIHALEAGGGLDASELLPGFSVPVVEVFE